MQIGSFNLENKVLIVAEIGNNHEGNFEVAQEMVRTAAACGVDAVKFQTFRTKYFVSASDPARYQCLSGFELSYQNFEELRHLAKSLGLLFISTPMDLKSADFLTGLVDCYKIASGDNNFYPLMEQVCKTGKPIILSSGLSDLDQTIKSKQFIEEQWRQRGIQQSLAILHCVSSYPVPPDQVNLAAIPFMKVQLGCTVGYSDHTLGVEACIIAAALGAQIIEKHFTIDKNYSSFRDHQLSADPGELKFLVEAVARVKVMLGKPEKNLQPSEASAYHLIRRSIVAAADLPRGHRLRWQDLTWIRPGTGLPPGEERKVLGKVLKRDLAFGEQILLADLE